MVYNTNTISEECNGSHHIKPPSLERRARSPGHGVCKAYYVVSLAVLWVCIHLSSLKKFVAM